MSALNGGKPGAFGLREFSFGIFVLNKCRNVEMWCDREKTLSTIARRRKERDERVRGEAQFACSKGSLPNKRCAFLCSHCPGMAARQQCEGQCSAEK